MAKIPTTNPTSGVHITVRGKKQSAIYRYVQKFTKLLRSEDGKRVRQVWIDGECEIRLPNATLLVAADGTFTFGEVNPFRGDSVTLDD